MQTIWNWFDKLHYSSIQKGFYISRMDVENTSTLNSTQDNPHSVERIPVVVAIADSDF